METKVCNKCGRELSLSDFYTNSKVMDKFNEIKEARL